MAIANDIIKAVNVHTGELQTYKEVAKWHDGTTMNDNKADGVIYRKKNDKYYKLQYTGCANAKWFGVKIIDSNSSLSDINTNTANIKKITDIIHWLKRIEFPSANTDENGAYCFNQSIVFHHNVKEIKMGNTYFKWTGSNSIAEPKISIGTINSKELVKHAKITLLLTNANTSDCWDYESNTGISLINFYWCTININSVNYFYNGVDCIGDRHGFAYNQTTIGKFYGCRNALRLRQYVREQETSTNGNLYNPRGWVNENIFWGGTFHTPSGSYQNNKNRSGITIETIAIGNVLIDSENLTGNNNNKFYGQSFEIGGNQDIEVYPIIIHNGAKNCFYDLRSEVLQSNGATYALATEYGSSRENEYSTAYSTHDRDIDYKGLFCTSSLKKLGDKNNFRLIYDIGNIVEKIISYDDNNFTIKDAYLFDNYFDYDVKQLKRNNTIQDNYVLFTAGDGVGIEIDTEGVKHFIATKNTVNEIGKMGRFSIRCYDINGNILGDTNTQHEYLKAGYKLFYSPSTNAYSQQSDNNFDFEFYVTDEVKKIKLSIVGAHLKSFKLYGKRGIISNLNSDVNTELFAIQKPNNNEGKNGVTVYNEDLSSEIHSWTKVNNTWEAVNKKSNLIFSKTDFYTDTLIPIENKLELKGIGQNNLGNLTLAESFAASNMKPRLTTSGLNYTGNNYKGGIGVEIDTSVSKRFKLYRTGLGRPILQLCDVDENTGVVTIQENPHPTMENPFVSTWHTWKGYRSGNSGVNTYYYNIPDDVKRIRIFDTSSINLTEFKIWDLDGNNAEVFTGTKLSKYMHSNSIPYQGYYKEGTVVINTDNSSIIEKWVKKTSDENNTLDNWKHIYKQGISGTTAQRPTKDLRAGMVYYDSDISKPIVYNGIGWVSYDGTTV